MSKDTDLRRLEAEIKQLGKLAVSQVDEISRLKERLEDKTTSLRVEIAAKQGAHNEIKMLEEENGRLRRLLLEGPANPQECAEFCKCALEDGDGKPCIDCEPERFTIA